MRCRPCKRPAGPALGVSLLLTTATLSLGCDESESPPPVSSTATGGHGAGGSSTTSSGGTGGSGGSDGGGGLAPAPSECRSVGSWTKSADFADSAHVSHPLPSFARAGYYYVHTMTTSGSERVLYSAPQSVDGSLGSWQQASPDHGGGPHGFTAVVAGGEAYHFRNGHIAHYPLTDQGLMNGDVELLESDPDSSFGGNRYVWDSAVAAEQASSASWIVHLGGFSFTGYEYRPDVFRSPVPIGSAFADTGLDHPNQRPGKAAFVAPPAADYGFVFTGESGGARLWRTRLTADGSLEAWVELASLPAGTGNERGDWFAQGRTLFVVRGSAVWAADVAAADGELSPWRAMPSLSEDQIDVSWSDGHLEGAAYGIMGGYGYLTGPKAVHYAPLQSDQPCAN